MTVAITHSRKGTQITISVPWWPTKVCEATKAKQSAAQKRRYRKQDEPPFDELQYEAQLSDTGKSTTKGEPSRTPSVEC